MKKYEFETDLVRGESQNIWWAEDTGFKVSTEKTKAIMISRRSFPITTIPRMNMWEKGEIIEQVRQHRILEFAFDIRMN
jgi:hypothetical protein